MRALVLAWVTLFASFVAAAPRAEIEWVTIPAGEFMMGSEAWPYTQPVHKVSVKEFQLAKTLVTVDQYKACVDAGRCTPPGADFGCNWGVKGRGEHPVNCVTWDQARAFSGWVGGRLPTEAEWEYAARGGGKPWRYPWGNADATCERAVISEHAGGRNDGVGCGRNSTWPVCSKPKGNSLHGLCDMAGNLYQWVQDWYHGSYDGAPVDGSAWEDAGATRAYRGGSWINAAGRARSASRRSFDPRDRGDHLGFRPARSR